MTVSFSNGETPVQLQLATHLRVLHRMPIINAR